MQRGLRLKHEVDLKVDKEDNVNQYETEGKQSLRRGSQCGCQRQGSEEDQRPLLRYELDLVS